eukprot:2684403-Rhodomonas_salina.1
MESLRQSGTDCTSRKVVTKFTSRSSKAKLFCSLLLLVLGASEYLGMPVDILIPPSPRNCPSTRSSTSTTTSSSPSAAPLSGSNFAGYPGTRPVFSGLGGGGGNGLNSEPPDVSRIPSHHHHPSHWHGPGHRARVGIPAARPVTEWYPWVTLARARDSFRVRD